MKKSIFALGLVLAASVAGAALVNNAVAVTETSQTLTVGTANAPAMSILVVNEGANEAFVCLFKAGLERHVALFEWSYGPLGTRGSRKS